MSDLVAIPITQPDNSKLVAVFEEALAEAKAGAITGAVLITTFKDKEWRGQWSGLALHSAMGYMARLTYRMNRDWDES
jgi:uncharacterized membrane protein YebE (DUF533 family)